MNLNFQQVPRPLIQLLRGALNSQGPKDPLPIPATKPDCPGAPGVLADFVGHETNPLRMHGVVPRSLHQRGLLKRYKAVY
jgi:hypothetical protein